MVQVCSRSKCSKWVTHMSGKSINIHSIMTQKLLFSMQGSHCLLRLAGLSFSRLLVDINEERGHVCFTILIEFPGEEVLAI